MMFLPIDRLLQWISTPEALLPFSASNKTTHGPGLTSATLSRRGSSQCSLHSQWLSRNVRTLAWAASAPRTRERIRPVEVSSSHMRGEMREKNAGMAHPAPAWHLPSGSAALLPGRFEADLCGRVSTALWLPTQSSVRTFFLKVIRWLGRQLSENYCLLRKAFTLSSNQNVELLKLLSSDTATELCN